MLLKVVKFQFLSRSGLNAYHERPNISFRGGEEVIVNPKLTARGADNPQGC